LDFQKFGTGNKCCFHVIGSQPASTKKPRKRIIFESDSEEEGAADAVAAGGMDTEPESEEEPDAHHDKTDWIKSYKIPKSGRKWSAEQLKNLRETFKGIDKLDDSILQGASLTEMAVVAKMKAGGGKVFSKAMAATYEELARTDTVVEKGTDNCTGAVHSSRFLRGYVGDATEIWKQGRGVVGMDGYEPISHYETVTVGLSGLISAKGWAETHSPGSKQLSIRLFTPAAVQSAWHSVDRPDTSKEFESVLEMRMGLMALEGAIHKIYPWNWSVKTILIFMTSVDFGENELKGRSDRLTVLADFIDDALKTNAQSWDEKKPFLSHENLCSRWAALHIKLGAGKGGGNNKGGGGNQGGKGGGGQGKNNEKGGKVRIPWGVCGNYNKGLCKIKDKSHVAFFDPDLTLRHECAKYLPDKRRACLGPHPMTEHK